MNKILNSNFNQHNISFNRKKNKEIKSMDSEIQTAINKLLQRAEREMPEYGDFAPISEKFENRNENLNIGEPSIKIVYANFSKDKTLKRLELEIPSKTGKSSANVAMELADKKAILKALSDKNLANRINDNIQNASSALEDGNYI